MKVKQLSTDKLKPYPNNTKEHPEKQVEKIAESIKEFGFNQPIVIDSDNEIIAGHGRLEAAKKLGYDMVPVVRKEGLTKEQVQAYRLADNRLNESEWEYEKLAEELEALEAKDYDLDKTGFDTEELEEILMDEESIVEEVGDLEDEYEEPEKEELKCPECGHVDSAGRFKQV